LIFARSDKLATARALNETTASHSLGASPALGAVTAKEVYATLDWLGGAQSAIEQALARRHLKDGTLVLCKRCAVPTCPRAA
jgi:hypothetical protein